MQLLHFTVLYLLCNHIKLYVVDISFILDSINATVSKKRRKQSIEEKKKKKEITD